MFTLLPRFERNKEEVTVGVAQVWYEVQLKAPYIPLSSHTYVRKIEPYTTTAVRMHNGAKNVNNVCGRFVLLPVKPCNAQQQRTPWEDTINAVVVKNPGALAVIYVASMARSKPRTAVQAGGEEGCFKRTSIACSREPVPQVRRQAVVLPGKKVHVRG